MTETTLDLAAIGAVVRDAETRMLYDALWDRHFAGEYDRVGLMPIDGRAAAIWDAIRAYDATDPTTTLDLAVGPDGVAHTRGGDPYVGAERVQAILQHTIAHRNDTPEARMSFRVGVVESGLALGAAPADGRWRHLTPADTVAAIQHGQGAYAMAFHMSVLESIDAATPAYRPEPAVYSVPAQRAPLAVVR